MALVSSVKLSFPKNSDRAELLEALGRLPDASAAVSHIASSDAVSSSCRDGFLFMRCASAKHAQDVVAAVALKEPSGGSGFFTGASLAPSAKAAAPPGGTVQVSFPENTSADNVYAELMQHTTMEGPLTPTVVESLRVSGGPRKGYAWLNFPTSEDAGAALAILKSALVTDGGGELFTDAFLKLSAKEAAKQLSPEAAWLRKPQAPPPPPPPASSSEADNSDDAPNKIVRSPELTVYVLLNRDLPHAASRLPTPCEFHNALGDSADGLRSVYRDRNAGAGYFLNFGSLEEAAAGAAALKPGIPVGAGGARVVSATHNEQSPWEWEAPAGFVAVGIPPPRAAAPPPLRHFFVDVFNTAGGAQSFLWLKRAKLKAARESPPPGSAVAAFSAAIDSVSPEPVPNEPSTCALWPTATVRAALASSSTLVEPHIAVDVEALRDAVGFIHGAAAPLGRTVWVGGSKEPSSADGTVSKAELETLSDIEREYRDKWNLSRNEVCFLFRPLPPKGGGKGVGEEAVDSLLHHAIEHMVLTRGSPNPPGSETIVLLSGDGNENKRFPTNFPTTVFIAARAGYRVEAWSWSTIQSANYRRVADVFRAADEAEGGPCRVQIRLLDDFYGTFPASPRGNGIVYRPPAQRRIEDTAQCAHPLAGDVKVVSDILAATFLAPPVEALQEMIGRALEHHKCATDVARVATRAAAFQSADALARAQEHETLLAEAYGAFCRGVVAAWPRTGDAAVRARVRREVAHLVGDAADEALPGDARARGGDAASAPLPIAGARGALDAALAAHHAVIVRGATGCGKSTQLPQYLADSLGGRVLVAQPHEIAARELSRRVAKEFNASGGAPGSIGLQVSFGDANRVNRRGSAIEFVKESYLVAALLQSGAAAGADGVLEGVVAVVLDEAHERTLFTDVLLGLLRVPRAGLKVLVCSASLSAATTHALREYLGGAHVVDVPGRPFPVEFVHAPLGAPGGGSAAFENYAAGAVREALRAHTDGGPGDVLVFLTGTDECASAAAAFKQGDGAESAHVLCLSGSNMKDAEEVFAPPPRGKTRKVVFATNIAESGLTIDGLRFVVDAGKVKRVSFDAARGFEQEHVEWVSVGAAEQRAGRVGRTAAGAAVRLYEMRDLPLETVPHVRSQQLELLVVAAAALKVHASAFPWFDAPPPEALAIAEANLATLGVLDAPRADAGGAAGAPPPPRLTALGRLVRELQADPSLVRLLWIGGERGAVSETCDLAGLLGVAGPLLRGLRPAFARELLLAQDQGAAAGAVGASPETSPNGDARLLLRVLDAYRAARAQLEATHATPAACAKALRTWAAERGVSEKHIGLATHAAKRFADTLTAKRGQKADAPLTEAGLASILADSFLLNVAVLTGRGANGAPEYALTRSGEPAVLPPACALSVAAAVARERGAAPPPPPQYIVYFAALKEAAGGRVQLHGVAALDFDAAAAREAAPPSAPRALPRPEGLIATLRARAREIGARERVAIAGLSTAVSAALADKAPAVAAAAGGVTIAVDTRAGVIEGWCAAGGRSALEATLETAVGTTRRTIATATVEMPLQGTSFRVAIGAGGEALELLAPSQFMSVELRGLPDAVAGDSTAVFALLSKLGCPPPMGMARSSSGAGNGPLRVTWPTAAAAAGALAALGASPGGVMLRADPIKSGGAVAPPRSFAALILSWMTSPATGEASVVTDSARVANAVATQLRSRFPSVLCDGCPPGKAPRLGQHMLSPPHQLFVDTHPAKGRFRVRIRSVPAHFDEGMITRVLDAGMRRVVTTTVHREPVADGAVVTQAASLVSKVPLPALLRGQTPPAVCPHAPARASVRLSYDDRDAAAAVVQVWAPQTHAGVPVRLELRHFVEFAADAAVLKALSATGHFARLRSMNRYDSRVELEIDRAAVRASASDELLLRAFRADLLELLSGELFDAPDADALCSTGGAAAWKALISEHAIGEFANAASACAP